MSEILSVFGVDWRLLIIQALNFGLLLFLLWMFLYRPIFRMLDKRQTLIKEGIEAAEASKEERGKIEEERNVKLSEATQEGERLLESARAKAKEDEARIITSAQARSEQIAAEAAARAEEVSRKAQQDAQKEAARLAVLAAEKVLRNDHVRKA